MNPALKKKIYHYAMVTLACAIMGIAMNTFYMPNKMLIMLPACRWALPA